MKYFEILLLSVLWESSTYQIQPTKFETEQKKKSKIGKVPVKIDGMYPQSRMDIVAVPGLFLTCQFDKNIHHFSDSLGFVDVFRHQRTFSLRKFGHFRHIFTGFSKKCQFSSRGFHKFLT